jgi:hypothetical protein
LDEYSPKSYRIRALFLNASLAMSARSAMVYYSFVNISHFTFSVL